MGNAVLLLIVVLLLLAGSVWLQIFLSTKNNKWLGLIIPLVCFMLSIVIVLSLAMYTASSEITTIFSMLVSVIPTFLMFNILTLIFLAIYFVCREKLKTKKQLDKMNVQDLV